MPTPNALIYEAHAKGLTQLHPDVPESTRGSYAALGHPAVVDHLTRIGVTTLELMPVLASTTEPRLRTLGLTNYWGYNPTDAHALHSGYASTADPERELAAAVDRLHDAGIAVVLDVVLNHTADGALPDDWYRADDHTGCGNPTDVNHPEFVADAVEALRSWRRRLGVDGFRFDLASALTRLPDGRPSPPGPLLAEVAADPDLAALHLVVEPWDAHPDGYALGRFGAPFAQWNDRFRDDVRDFWRGRGAGVRDLATRLAGSSDLVESPERSINFVTTHDGFTLRDVVSYAERHNATNGEGGRDGHADNRSDNLGIEGDTDDPDIVERRQTRARAMLTTLLLSRGVPMLRMGDEIGHTQRGNNNAYCHDDELSWIAWRPEAGWDLRDHVANTLSDRAGWVGPDHLTDDEVDWLHPSGRVMAPGDWADDGQRALGMRLGDRTLWLDAHAQTALLA